MKNSSYTTARHFIFGILLALFFLVIVFWAIFLFRSDYIRTLLIENNYFSSTKTTDNEDVYRNNKNNNSSHDSKDQYTPEFTPVPSIHEKRKKKSSIIERADADPGTTLSSCINDCTVYTTPADVVEAVEQGVVGILNYSYDNNLDEYTLIGSGSGFFVSENGYLLTNAHVVSEADKLEIRLFDGTIVEAVMVGYDLSTDIAVIKSQSSTTPQVLTLGNSDTARVGEYVLAIGNPLGTYNLYGTVSLGIISGISREINIEGYTNNYIQTDAALNPGNSGGPMFNMSGQVIAMNSAKALNAGTDEYGCAVDSEGIGFALPINDVIQIANNIIHYGGVIRPGIGITVYTLDAKSAEQMELIPGVLVYSVTPLGPADEAGIKAGDVIVKYNGIDAIEKEILTEDIKNREIGYKANITLFRGGEYIDVTVIVGDMNIFNN